MGMGKMVLGFCLLLLLLCNAAFAQETITLTTYYPAPFGVYRTMRIITSNDPANQANTAEILMTNLGGNPSIQFQDNDPTGDRMGRELVIRGGNVSFVNANRDFDDNAAGGSFPPAANPTNPSVIRVRELWLCTGDSGL